MSGLDLLVVDAQVLQTPAWDRGIGRWSLRFLEALSRHPDRPRRIHLVLSSEIAAQERRELVRDALHDVEVELLPLHPGRLGTGEVADANRELFEQRLTDLARPGERVAFLSLAPLVDYVVCPLPRLPEVSTHVVVYDLIPYLFPATYLSSSFSEGIYLTRLASMLEADHFHAISGTAADELVQHLGVPRSRLTVLPGGAATQEVPDPAGAEPPADAPAAPFVLLPTGNDRRKNNLAAVDAFARFQADHPEAGSWELLLTSTFDEAHRRALRERCASLRFTGVVDDARMTELFATARCVLFPTFAEGLGLPLLEAMAFDTPVACSDIPPFREISPTAFSWFDPTSVASIAAGIAEAVTRPVDRVEYARARARYTWENTAQVFTAALAAGVPERVVDRPPLVVAAPDPTAASPAARAVVLTHAELARHATVSYRVGRPRTRRTFRGRPDLLRYERRWDPARHGGDPVLVHLDASAASADPLLVALTERAVVVLHEGDLRAAWGRLRRQNRVARGRLAAERRLDAALDAGGTLLASVTAHAHAVVCTDAATGALVTRIAAATGADARVVTLPGPVGPPAFRSYDPPGAACVELGTVPEQLTDEERVDLLRSFAFALVPGWTTSGAALRVLDGGALAAADPADLDRLRTSESARAARRAEQAAVLESAVAGPWVARLLHLVR